jgi:hypothetical protein
MRPASGTHVTFRSLIRSDDAAAQARSQKDTNRRGAMNNRNYEMSYDSSDTPARRRASHFGWFSGLLPRSSGGRPTHVSDLPPRVLNDIGLHQDVVDAFLRHRR